MFDLHATQGDVSRSCIFILSLIALYFSGARAAILLALIGIFTILYVFVNRRTNIWLACFLSIITISCFALIGVEGVFEYFRLSANLDKASSGRYLAALEAIELILPLRFLVQGLVRQISIPPKPFEYVLLCASN